MGLKTLFVAAFMIVMTVWYAQYSSATPTGKTARIPDFRDKKQWVHLKDRERIHIMDDEQGNAVPWGVTRSYQKAGRIRSYGFEMLVFLGGEGVVVYKQWGAPHARFQTVLQKLHEKNGWSQPIPGSRNEFFVRVSGGRVINFVLLAYPNNASHPTAYVSLADPREADEVPEFPSASIRKLRWL